MFTPRLLRLFCFALLLFGTALVACGASPAVDSIPISEEYVRRSWEVEDGLPSNTITGLAQTLDGYLWLATSSGLARFDGSRFVSFHPDSSPGLQSNRIMTVFAASDGSLWIGLDKGGIARRIGEHFETVSPRGAINPSVEWVSSFGEEPGGSVWAGFVGDFLAGRWQKGELKVLRPEGIGTAVDTRVCVDRDGNSWVATGGGCGFFSHGRFRAVDSARGPWPFLTPARDGGVWAVRSGYLLRYQPDGSVQVLGRTELSVRVLYEDSAGNLWIGTDISGLVVYRPRKVLPGQPAAGAFERVPTSHSAIVCISEDREGNLWVGTSGGGVNRIRPSRFVLRQTQHGLRTDSVVSVCEDAEGKLWLACRDGHPVRAMDAGNRTFAEPGEWIGGSVMAMTPDRQGGVWMSTLHGLVYWREGTYTRMPPWEPLTGQLLDRDGALWVATIKNGLVRMRDGQLDPVPSTNGLSQPRALAQDAAGRIWVGTENGLVFYSQDGAFIPVSLPQSARQVRFIVPDEEDTVWIGAAEGGLYRWRAGLVARLPTDIHLRTDDLRVLALDSDELWFGTGGGIWRVARREVNAVLDGRQKSMRVVSYGRNDGIPYVDFMFGFKNAAIRTKDGHLWFAGNRGALEVFPEKSTSSASFSEIVIDGVEVAGAQVPFSSTGKTTLPDRQAPVQIRYTLPELSAPEQVHFRYRLGRGEEWIEAGDQRTATFARLPPGDYRFEVAAAIADGPWLQKTAIFDFAVPPAWWETLWFRFGGTVAGAVGLAAFVRAIVKRRMRARVRRLEQKYAMERERTRIARDMHDQIGATLTQMALFAELAKAESPTGSAAETHAASLVNTARDAVNALDEIVWAVNPRNDSLERLIEYLGQYTVDYLRTAGIRCRLDIPEHPPEKKLTAEFRHDVFLIVQEALNNAVKHASATEVRFTIHLAGDGMDLEIADNGVGIPAGVNDSAGNGLENMRSRAADLGGVCRIKNQPLGGACLQFHFLWPN